MTVTPAVLKHNFNFEKASVLTVDPSQISTEVMSLMLNGFGFRRLFRCANIDAGIEVAKLRALDLILIDPYAFGGEAYDFIRWLRSEKANPNRETPAIIATAYTDIRMVTNARQCGADYVLNKPFSTRTFLERIIWVAQREGRHSDLMAPSELVSQAGSGMELW